MLRALKTHFSVFGLCFNSHRILRHLRGHSLFKENAATERDKAPSMGPWHGRESRWDRLDTESKGFLSQAHNHMCVKILGHPAMIRRYISPMGQWKGPSSASSGSRGSQAGHRMSLTSLCCLSHWDLLSSHSMYRKNARV